MSIQTFSAAQREAIWLAHNKKCAYTRELIDVSSFHIDHIIPETLEQDAVALDELKTKLGLRSDFDIHGYANLVPCHPGANLQKGALILDPSHMHYFLGIAADKKVQIEKKLTHIERRKNRGRALILLQQSLERGELSGEEVTAILQEHADRPEQIFELLAGMHFADCEEIRFVAKSEIEALRDRPIKLGANDDFDGVALVNKAHETCVVRTCREYDDAVQQGYFATCNVDFKMSCWFERLSGLLKSLQAATRPKKSFVANPRVGILDLDLIPYSFFPYRGDGEPDPKATYQSRVDDGTLVVKRISHNSLRIQEHEGMGQQLVEVTRADFNGDGTEDILLFEHCYATHGTLGYGGIRLITRSSLNGKFEELPHGGA